MTTTGDVILQYAKKSPVRVWQFVGGVGGWDYVNMRAIFDDLINEGKLIEAGTWDQIGGNTQETIYTVPRGDKNGRN